MEGKEMTFKELADYANAARSKYVKNQEEKHCKKDNDIRSIIKMIIDKAEKCGVVKVEADYDGVYLNDSKIYESKGIIFPEELKNAIDLIPALYAEFEDGRNLLDVTFRRSEDDSEQ